MKCRAEGLFVHKPYRGFPSVFPSAAVIRQTDFVFELDVKTHCWNHTLGLPDYSENAGFGSYAKAVEVLTSASPTCDGMNELLSLRLWQLLAGTVKVSL